MARPTATNLVANGSSADTAGPGTYAIASRTYTAGCLYLLGLSYSANGAAPVSPVPSGGVSTWTLLVENPYKASGANQVSIAVYWGHCTSTTTASVTLTVPNGSTCTGARWHMIEVTGHDTSGAGLGAFDQVPVLSVGSIGIGANITATLSAPVDVESIPVVFLGANENGSAWTEEGGWTVLNTGSQANPQQRMTAICNSTTFDTSVTIQNTSGSATDAGLICVGIRPPVVLNGNFWGIGV